MRGGSASAGSGGGRAARSSPIRRAGRDRFVEDREDARDDGLAGAAHVEAHGQCPQRQEELGRDEQDGERTLEGDAAIEQAQADLDGHQRDGDGGAPLQHQRRLERGPQHVHGGVAVAGR